MIQVKIPSPTPIVGFDRITLVFDFRCTDLLGQIRIDRMKLSHKLNDVLDKIKFLCVLFVGPRIPASTRTAPTTDVSG